MTFPEITPPGYPFLFRNREEQKAMLRSLLTTPSLRREWGAKASGYVRENYASDRWAESYVKLFEELNAKRVLGTPQDVLDYARDELHKAGRLTIREYYNLIRDRKVNGRTPISNQSFPITKVALLAKTVGGKTRIIGNEQYVWMD